MPQCGSSVHSLHPGVSDGRSAGASRHGAIDSRMTNHLRPHRPEIDAFFVALSRLTLSQWATIVKRFMQTQSQALDASDIVAGMVAGSDVHQRKARLEVAHQAYDRIPVETGLLPDSVHVDGEDVPLRGLVEMATLYVVQALLVKEAIADRPDIWSALTYPFAEFIDLRA